jgi:hypothetical protein
VETPLLMRGLGAAQDEHAAARVSGSGSPPAPKRLTPSSSKRDLGRAKGRVAITIPREARWIKLGFWAMNAWLWVRRIAFRGYVHPHAQILDVAATHGFHATHHDRGLLWDSLVLQHQSTQT